MCPHRPIGAATASFLHLLEQFWIKEWDAIEIALQLVQKFTTCPRLGSKVLYYDVGKTLSLLLKPPERLVSFGRH
jgi:hypothetical protein